jgi:hypothetical protein
VPHAISIICPASRHPAAHPHSGQQCPFCEQEIPLDRLEEIRGLIAAREQLWLAEATGRLRDQHARERAQAEAKAKADLEQARRDSSASVERLTTEAAAREASIRAEPTRVAEEAAQLRLEEASPVQLEETAGLLMRLQLAEQATIAAEERMANVSTELETIRAESAAAIRKATEEAAGREESSRAEAAQSPGSFCPYRAGDRVPLSLARTLGRRVRRQYVERRAGGDVVHVEVAPGIVIVGAARMLDPAACAGMALGAPRVTLVGLAELHQLLTERGFRRSSRDVPTIVKESTVRNSPAPGMLSAARRQLSMPFDSTALRGMTPSERQVALAGLASLLLEAANSAAEERDDDRR